MNEVCCCALAGSKECEDCQLKRPYTLTTTDLSSRYTYVKIDPIWSNDMNEDLERYLFEIMNELEYRSSL